MPVKNILSKIKKRFEGSRWGDFRSRLKGEGIEIEDWRKYQPWDDVRSINWKLTAKTGQLYVNVYQTLKDVDFHVFFDINQNWKAKLDGKSVWEAIVGEFENLRDFFTRKKAKIKLFWYDEGIKAVAVKKRWLFWLPLKKTKPKLGYQSHLTDFVNLQLKTKKRRVILVVSDFLALDEDLAKKLKALNVQNEVLLMKIVPWERFVVGTNFDWFSFSWLNPKLIDELRQLWV